MKVLPQKGRRYPPIQVINRFDYPIGPRSKAPLILENRPLKPYLAELARSHINSGVFFLPNNDVVPGTDYLQKAWNIGPPERVLTLPTSDTDPLLVIYNAGWRNYYHRLIQGYFAAWIFRTHYSELAGRFIHPQTSENEKGIMSQMGITDKNCIFLDPDQSYELSNLFFVPPTYGDYAFSPSPLLKDYGQDIASRVAPASQMRSKVYISRKDTDKRRMLNEEHLESILREKGYEIVSLSGKSFSEQVSIFKAAEKIVAPHGAGLSNLVFCASGTEIVEMTNHTYINPCFSALGQVLELAYTCHISPTLKPHKVQSAIQWEADIESLLPLL
jgi:hypothetical protein